MLENLIEQSREYDELKSDYGPDAIKRFGFDSVGSDLIIPQDNEIYPLTDHAFGQVCARLGNVCWPNTSRTLPREYLMACPPELRAKQLNHWIDEAPDNRRWFVRMYEDEVRAVLTNHYGVVDVTDTLGWVRQALDSRPRQRPVEVRRTTVNPDILHLRILERHLDTNDGPYATGAYVTTGETGNRRISVAPLVWCTSCDNSIIIGKGAYTAMHRGSTRLLQRGFMTAIWQAFQGAVFALDGLLASRATEDYEHYDKVVEDLCKKNGWTEKVHDTILLDSQGENLFSLVNAITRSAQRVEDPTMAVQMEVYAGGLLQ